MSILQNVLMPQA